MKRLITICLVVGMVFAVSSVANATLYLETFDNDDAGWLAAYVPKPVETLEPVYSGTGGNTGGCISSSLQFSADTPKRLFAFEPAAIIAGVDGTTVQDVWGNIAGQLLTADFKISGEVFSYPSGDTLMVRFYLGAPGNEYFMSNDTHSWDPSNDTNWTTHQVKVVEENFVPMHTEDDFGYVMANLSDIGIQFGPSEGQGYIVGYGNVGFTGSGELMLDNFGTVPEPAMIALFGIGILGLLRRKRKA